MKNIRLYTGSSDDFLVRGLVRVYQEAFGGEPWNEGYKCPLCEAIFPLSFTETICPPCRSNDNKQIELVEYWPAEQVMADFYAEMAKPGAICVVDCGQAGPDWPVRGFAWGYDLTVGPATEQKLESPGLSDLVTGTFFYLDECAVLPSYQSQGRGKVLLGAIFSQQPHRLILLRTLMDSRMCRMIQRMGGEIVQHISRNRVIMQLQVK